MVGGFCHFVAFCSKPPPPWEFSLRRFAFIGVHARLKNQKTAGKRESSDNPLAAFCLTRFA
jgi:hypothetical protein